MRRSQKLLLFPFNLERIFMSNSKIVHNINITEEYQAGLRYGKDPVARAHYERAIELAEEHEAFPQAYYQAHERLIELYEFVMEKPKADYYRKRLEEMIKQDK
jgi:hypothetical protein